MVHELKMAVIDSILQLRALHWSARRIARELGIDRGTIGKYLRNADAGSKPAISPAGSGASKPATFPPVPGTRESETDGADCAASLPESEPAISPAGSPGAGDDRREQCASPEGATAPLEVTTPVASGRPSECTPYRSIIVAKLDLDLSAQRIFQDLVSDHGFTGKVESGVKYVQNNALKAKKFVSLLAENEYLAHWETAVADTRIHGTTRQQVGRVFREVERPALQPLPRERFPSFQEAPRKVSRDGHVEVAKAYYSVPPEYLGQTVWARWDARLVRIFNPRFEQIALHVRHEQGRFSTDARHLAPEKIRHTSSPSSHPLRIRSLPSAQGRPDQR